MKDTNRHKEHMSSIQGHNTKFFLRGQSHFSRYFPGREILFPGRIFWFLVDPKNFSSFEKWKAKKKKKVPFSFCHFATFSSFNFQFSTFPFTIFLVFFSISPFSLFFLCSFFPVDDQKFPSQKSQGGTLPPAIPPACYTTASIAMWV